MSLPFKMINAVTAIAILIGFFPNGAFSQIDSLVLEDFNTQDFLIWPSSAWAGVVRDESDYVTGPRSFRFSPAAGKNQCVIYFTGISPKRPLNDFTDISFWIKKSKDYKGDSLTLHLKQYSNPLQVLRIHLDTSWTKIVTGIPCSLDSLGELGLILDDSSTSGHIWLDRIMGETHALATTKTLSASGFRPIFDSRINQWNTYFAPPGITWNDNQAGLDQRNANFGDSLKLFLNPAQVQAVDLSLSPPIEVTRMVHGSEVREKEYRLYGLFEAHMSAKAVRGVIDGLFLYRDNPWQEIDFEIAHSENPRLVCLTKYFNRSSAAYGEPSRVIIPNSTEYMHYYAIKWTSSSVELYIDSVLAHRFDTKIPNRPMQFRTNIWSALSGWAGTYKNDSARMDIDWVRYSCQEPCNSVSQPPPVPYIIATPVLGIAPLNVTFNGINNGGPIDSLRWSFPPLTGNFASNPQSAILPVAGYYGASLQMYGPGGSNQYSQNGIIQVTAPPAPAAPILGYPISGAVDQATNLSFNWNLSSGANTYRFQISTDQRFLSIFLDDSGLTSNNKIVGPLAPGTTYYWRVRGKNSGGWGAPSEVWSFSTRSTTFILELNSRIPTRWNLERITTHSGASQHRLSVPISGYTQVQILGIQGQRILEISQNLQPGVYLIQQSIDVSIAAIYCRILSSGHLRFQKRIQ